MLLFTTATPTEIDTPNGSASHVAATAAATAGLTGSAWTLKADGIVLAPNDSVPPTAQVLEVVELVVDEPPAAAPSRRSKTDDAAVTLTVAEPTNA